jgi:uncharacterized protein (TIGR03437 family)
VVAVYSGDAAFAPSTSGPRVLPVIVNVAGVISFTLAPEEIATIWGAELANSDAAAASPPLPTTLAGATVTVTESQGASRLAPLYYGSAVQINFVVPAGTADGPATIVVAHTGGAAVVLTAVVSRVEPSVFAANADGRGVAAAQITRVHPDGTQSFDNTAVPDAAGHFVASPIAFGSDVLYLILYATGLRNRSSLDHVTCSVGNLTLPVTYAGAQSQYPGMDQIVVLLPATLKGAGPVNVTLTADGQASNTVSVTFQ